ncbi:MAG: hypothetical protein F4029_03995 [Gammaproteobacteria bacterium]|nr:hypothetical protein [Gammaproteobacteria bacterium]MYK45371.1 hypothetical protein [Gammaproteobacteria bacterium]
MRDASTFPLGGVLAAGTRYYVRNLALILPVSLLAFVPAFVVIAVSVDEGFRFDLGPAKVEFRYRELTSLVCGVWLQAGLSTIVIRQLEGSYQDFGETLVASIHSLFRCAHVALIGAVVFVVGLMALALPGLVLATMLWVAMPSAAVERCGLVGALRRSYELTREYRLRILGLFLAFVVVLLIVEFAIGLVLFPRVPEGLSSQEIVKQIGGIFIGGLVGSIVAVSYYYLRTIKEGASSKAIAQAFD